MLLRTAVTLVALVAGAAPAWAAAPSLQHWLDGAAGIEPWIIQKQEHLHTIPELMFDTPKTYAALERILSELGVSHRCALLEGTVAVSSESSLESGLLTNVPSCMEVVGLGLTFLIFYPPMRLVIDIWNLHQRHVKLSVQLCAAVYTKDTLQIARSSQLSADWVAAVIKCMQCSSRICMLWSSTFQDHMQCSSGTNATPFVLEGRMEIYIRDAYML